MGQVVSNINGSYFEAMLGSLLVVDDQCSDFFMSIQKPPLRKVVTHTSSDICICILSIVS